MTNPTWMGQEQGRRPFVAYFHSPCERPLLNVAADQVFPRCWPLLAFSTWHTEELRPVILLFPLFNLFPDGLFLVKMDESILDHF